LTTPRVEERRNPVFTTSSIIITKQPPHAKYSTDPIPIAPNFLKNGEAFAEKPLGKTYILLSTGLVVDTYVVTISQPSPSSHHNKSTKPARIGVLGRAETCTLSLSGKFTYVHTSGVNSDRDFSTWYYKMPGSRLSR
jgi:hypothetical protein